MDLASKCFIKQDNFVTREIAGETIIVPIRSHVADLDSIYTLNEVGTLIWSLVDGKTPLPNLRAIAPERVCRDVPDCGPARAGGPQGA